MVDRKKRDFLKITLIFIWEVHCLLSPFAKDVSLINFPLFSQQGQQQLYVAENGEVGDKVLRNQL